MTSRRATCRCGQLSASCAGEPVRISACHCLECQKRTGSAFSVQARFADEHITISGRSHSWQRTGDSGNVAIYHFCPDCGSTVYYKAGPFPGLTAISVGAFADPGFPPPTISIFESRKYDWAHVDGAAIVHHD